MTVAQLDRAKTGELEWLDGASKKRSHRSFKSWDAWLEHCDKTPATTSKTWKPNPDGKEVKVVRSSRRTPKDGGDYGRKWSGTEDWDECMQLGKFGSDDGVEEMRRYITQFSKALGGMIKLPEYNYDVTGHDFDVAAVCENRPEAWFRPDDVYVDGVSPDTAEVWYNPEYSGWIDVKTIAKRGGIACALVSLLEQAGIPTRLVVTYGTTRGGHRHTADVVMKDYSMPLELRRFGFAVANPASCRRLSFADCETLPRAHRRGLGINDQSDGGYGSPCNHERIPKNAIVFHHISWSDENDWNDAEFTKKWMLEKLKSKGVQLIEGAIR